MTSRMTLSKAIERRMLTGDLQVDRDGSGIFLPYDNVIVNMIGSQVVFELRQRTISLGHVSTSMHDFVNGATINFTGIEGRMRINEEVPQYRDARP